MKRTTKIQGLKNHLNRYGSITKMTAARKFGIYGLKEQLNRLANQQRMFTKTIMIPQIGGQPYGKYTVVK